MSVAVGILHPGEMGAAMGACLVESGHLVRWAAAGRSEATRERAGRAGLVDVGTVEDLAGASDVLLSVCPPHAAAELARSVVGFAGQYVDANAISPKTARAIAEVVESSGAQFVDGGIIGGPPRAGSSTRLYLSGSWSGSVASLFAGTTVQAESIGDEVGAASALKMAYAAWTKGTAALLLAVRSLARAEGVEDDLLREWQISQPDLVARSVAAARSATSKGWRWIAEMEYIADTFDAAALPREFHAAAAEVYRRAPRGADVQDSDALLLNTIDALRKQEHH